MIHFILFLILLFIEVAKWETEFSLHVYRWEGKEISICREKLRVEEELERAFLSFKKNWRIILKNGGKWDIGKCRVDVRREIRGFRVVIKTKKGDGRFEFRVVEKDKKVHAIEDFCFIYRGRD